MTFYLLIQNEWIEIFFANVSAEFFSFILIHLIHTSLTLDGRYFTF